MLTYLAKNVAQRFGFHVERMPNGQLGWNQSIAVNFPVELRSRWGHGLPRNPFVQAALDEQRDAYWQSLAHLKSAESVLERISHHFAEDDPEAPFWNNTWFTGLDAASLVAFLLARKPKRYIEIGSGFSTRFCRRAVRDGRLATTITSLDPQPRAGIDGLCDNIIRRPLENCDLTLFDQLEPGDIVFFDGSHRALPNSDVTVFFLEVLPRLKPGVLIQVHDIFLPDDYPPAWNKRAYSEQYLLAAMLLFGRRRVRVLLPCYFVSTERALSEELRRVLTSPRGSSRIPLCYDTLAAQPACAFWFELAD